MSNTRRVPCCQVVLLESIQSSLYISILQSFLCRGLECWHLIVIKEVEFLHKSVDQLVKVCLHSYCMLCHAANCKLSMFLTCHKMQVNNGGDVGHFGKTANHPQHHSTLVKMDHLLYAVVILLYLRECLKKKLPLLNQSKSVFYTDFK